MMERGEIRRERDYNLFLISTTHGAETTGLAAMMATINEFKKYKMIDSTWTRGEDLKLRLGQIISKHALDGLLQLSGDPCLFALSYRNAFGVPYAASLTLLMSEMIDTIFFFQSF